MKKDKSKMYDHMVDTVNAIESNRSLKSPILNSLKILNTLNVLKTEKILLLFMPNHFSTI